MKIAIVGSGVIGVTAAYLLARAGHRVTVIDRQEGAGRETSFANGGFLSPSMPEPWNTPGCWRLLLSSLGRSDAPLQLRFKALPSLAGWGISFLRNSELSAYERNTVSNLRLSLHSLEVLKWLRQEAQIEYASSAAGALKLFRSCTAFDHALAAADRLQQAGLTFRRLSRDQTVAVEPALAPVAARLIGSIHYRLDEVGDAYGFCVALAERARQRGVEFLFGTSVTSLEVRSSTVIGVQTSAGRVTADQYVLAAGSYSPLLAAPIGVRIPVRPAKGYSVTFDLPDSGVALGLPVVDDDLHAGVIPLGRALRIAGTAEFAGFDLTLRRERIRSLMQLAQEILPTAGLNPASAKPWCGLRPMSADGVPIIGRTSVSNLWVSTGHGHLGWTMAAGSAKLLANMISGEAPSLDPQPYSLDRFSSHRIRGTNRDARRVRRSSPHSPEI